jgi:hypothetical protein
MTTVRVPKTETFENLQAGIKLTSSELLQRVERLERIVAAYPVEMLDGMEADSASSHGFEMWIFGLLTGFCICYGWLKQKGVIK